MNRNERLRRVLICTCHFTQNLAFYRAGWNGNNLIKPAQFWMRINGNCLDIAVVEWCKLFGERRGKHCWRNIITDQDAFKADLFGLVSNEGYYDAYVDQVKRYRDKFIAHLDDELTAHIPNMDDALSLSRLYYGYVANETITSGAIGGLPRDIEEFYNHCFNLAENEYTS